MLCPDGEYPQCEDLPLCHLPVYHGCYSPRYLCVCTALLFIQWDSIMSQPRLFIVHGFTANPDKHWFPWLKGRAEALGMEVIIPAMPNTMAPQESEWLETLRHQVGRVDENTWFIGHSLGCITILRYLMEQPADRVAAGIIMVSGFDEPVANLPELNEFTTEPLTITASIARIPHQAVIASLNDDIVPTAFTLRLAQRLEAPLYALPASGHFLDREGFDTLPLIETLLRDFTRPM